MSNISISNISKSTPLWWQRLESSLMFVLVGMIPLIQSSSLINSHWKTETATFILPVVILVVKGFGMFLGETPPHDSVS